MLEIPIEVVDSTWTTAEHLVTWGLSALGVGGVWIKYISMFANKIARPLVFDFINDHLKIRGVKEGEDCTINVEAVKGLIVGEVTNALPNLMTKTPIAKKLIEGAVMGTLMDEANGDGHAKRVKGAVALVANAKKAGVKASVEGEHVVLGTGLKFNTRTGKPDWNANLKFRF